MVQGNFLVEMLASVRKNGIGSVYWGFTSFCLESFPFDIMELVSCVCLCVLCVRCMFVLCVAVCTPRLLVVPPSVLESFPFDTMELVSRTSSFTACWHCEMYVLRQQTPPDGGAIVP